MDLSTGDIISYSRLIVLCTSIHYNSVVMVTSTKVNNNSTDCPVSEHILFYCACYSHKLMLDFVRYEAGNSIPGWKMV